MSIMPDSKDSLSSERSSRNIIAFIVLLVLIGGMGAYIYLKPKTHQKNFYLRPLPSSENKQSPDSVIVTVGKEALYQKDYDFELTYHPEQSNASVRQTILAKMITDSVILQAGQTDGLIKLDDTVYNSVDKNYLKRIQAVEQVQQNIEQKTEHMRVSVVSIWFYNNNRIGPLGYEGGKAFAQKKISDLYKNVKDKKMTMDEAGQAILNDSAISQVDVAYRSNALATFEVTAGDQMTFDPEFDKQIRKLKPGELTQVYILKDKEVKTGEMKDAVFIFAKMEKISGSASMSNFDTWLDQKRKLYEILY
jgi:hypothetical protein